MMNESAHEVASEAKNRIEEAIRKRNLFMEMNSFGETLLKSNPFSRS
jgi:hypothetical protein|tara:strand:- start:5010 stop:5150 length:141 start_codon:yes stop_codon:yes gene_type:complete